MKVVMLINNSNGSGSRSCRAKCSDYNRMKEKLTGDRAVRQQRPKLPKC